MQGRPFVEVERTWMSFRVPQADAARGTAVIVPGLYGVPEFLFGSVEEALIDDGWAVVRLLAPSSRFMELRELTLDPRDVDASARDAARWFDERFAEVAYACEAGVARLHGTREHLIGKPVVAIGMSGGALALPAVAARLLEARGEPVDAAVLVSGAENMLAVTGRSDYTELIDAVRWRWPGWEEGDVLPPRELVARVSPRYLDHAELDPANLAWAFGDSPVLMVQGSRDRAVPAELGDALWERLGRPERWMASAGHIELFVRLWISVRDIATWLDRAVPRTDG